MEPAFAKPVPPIARLQFNWARAFAPRVMPAYGITVAMAAMVIITVVLTDFTYSASELNSPILMLMGLAAAGVFLRGLGYMRIGSGVEAVALFSAISLAAPLCAAILASTNLPLADEMLARWDRLAFFGFNRTDLAHWVMQRDMLFSAVQMVYHSLIVQPSILIALLFATGREGRGFRLLFAWGLALVLSIGVFACLPALGSPPFFLDYLDTLNGARDGSLRVVGREMLTGIITFPSFHAAAAVLLGWGFWRIPYLGPLMAGLNALMFLSAAVASHYLVDLIAGGFIAVLAICLADKAITRIENYAELARKSAA